MLNKATLIGNLGADPDIRHTQDGTPVANLSIATNEKWRDKNTGEKRERTEWHRVTVWGEGLCNVLEQYVRKGSKVYIEGQLQTRKWEDQNGITRYTTEIVLRGFNSQLVMLDSKGSGPPHSAEQPDSYGEEEFGRRPQEADPDDEIPF